MSGLHAARGQKASDGLALSVYEFWSSIFLLGSL
jgi:hypothetical protein